jgi:hypothetical protein
MEGRRDRKKGERKEAEKHIEDKKGGRGKGEMMKKKYKIKQNYRPRNHRFTNRPYWLFPDDVALKEIYFAYPPSCGFILYTSSKK